jgi:hypothetical protein
MTPTMCASQTSATTTRALSFGERIAPSIHTMAAAAK